MDDLRTVSMPPPADADRLSHADRPAHVVDLRAWHETPGIRRLRPPRALWQRMPSGEPVRPPAIVPVAAPIPRAAAPVSSPVGPAAALPLPGPLLVVTCAESRVVEQLRQHLPVASVLQNLGGVMPRTGRSVRVQADAATVDAALEQCGVRHVVCVGHLGCRVAEGSGRVIGPPANETAAEARRRQRLAVEHHVFTQLQRVRAYLRQRDASPTVRLTGLWVDERTGHVHAFDPAQRRFARLEAFDLLRYSVTVPGRDADDDERAEGRAGER